MLNSTNAIDGFRGSLKQELAQFAVPFSEAKRLSITSKICSINHIAQALVALRAPRLRPEVDQAVGMFRDESTYVQILSNSGNGLL